jgi:hypothetical protein
MLLILPEDCYVQRLPWAWNYRVIIGSTLAISAIVLKRGWLS